MIDINRYNQDTTKKKLVLQIINKQAAITRSELCADTGLSMTSVTKFTSSLIEDGIVQEKGALESTGGRKSVLLGINPEYGYIIGIDLGGYAVKCGVIRMDGSLISEWFIPNVDDNVMPIKCLDPDSLCNKIADILEQFGKERFMAICVGVSGMVDHAKGKIIFCPNIGGWDNILLTDILQERFGLPAFLDTSARCMALAEQHFGAGRNVPNQVFISLGSYDIAAAIIIESQMFRGSHGFSGEFGHVMSSDQGVVCTCGNFDCLELSATMKMILGKIYQDISQYNGFSPLRQLMPNITRTLDITPEVVRKAMESGDKQCYDAINIAGVRVGTALANMLNILNPELVIIGGGVAENFPSIMNTIQETVRKRALVTIQQNLDIRKASLGWQGAVIGSATLALLKFFE